MVLKVGMRVRVRVPDKPELDGRGFLLAGPVQRDGCDIWQVDMGDHDNWFPADWLAPLDQGGNGLKK